MIDEEDQALREDDEYNRAVLLQARQRKQTEQVSIKLDEHTMPSSRFGGAAGGSPSTIVLSMSTNKTEDNQPSPSVAVGDSLGAQASKRVRLSFPPDKYANLDEEVSSAYMADLQTPKLTYT